MNLSKKQVAIIENIIATELKIISSKRFNKIFTKKLCNSTIKNIIKSIEEYEDSIKVTSNWIL